MMCFIEELHKLLLILLAAYNCFDCPDYNTNDYCNHELAKNPLACYWNGSGTLRNIIGSLPPKDKSIFFVDTSCDSHTFRRIIVKKRLACAVESAARHNPNRPVYLLYTSPGEIIHDGGQYGDILDGLRTYDNIRLRYVNFESYLYGTPVEKLTNKILRTIVRTPRYLTSDILRWVSLWKFGGITLDDDVIVIQPFDDLPKNFVATENDQSLTDGVLSFSHDGDGNSIVTKCLEYLNSNFAMVSYKRNGQEAITRVASELCGTNNVSAMQQNNCNNQLKIFRPHYFYPVPFDNWMDYYRPSEMASVMNKSRDSYTLHLWKFRSGNHQFSINRNGPYVRFARKHCPRVLEKMNKYL